MTKADKVARALREARAYSWNALDFVFSMDDFEKALRDQGLAIVEREPSQAEIDEATRELVKRTK